MNFNSSTSYSSSDDEENMQIIQYFQQRQAMICFATSNNNMIIEYLQQNRQPIHGGSVPGHIIINRDREAADRRLYNDYFADSPLYNETMVHKRYWMSRSLFLRIVDVVKAHDHYFQQRVDSTGRRGLSHLQKVTSTFRMLVYDLPADATDEYVKIGESTAIERMKIFFLAIVEIFADEYLRAPTSSDIARLLYVGKKRGFQECWGAWIACTGSGKIVPLRGSDNMQVVVEN